MGNTFGARIAISGDTVVIGATGDDDNGVDSGSAYVYEKPIVPTYLFQLLLGQE